MISKIAGDHDDAAAAADDDDAATADQDKEWLSPAAMLPPPM